ncbi:hypothetical protein [Micromonospora sp. WMMD710]|uniref:hypothetical protein n=1 Tax=Micromonospora sp. WMMD710 TaxID=3016085 RepID=UPI002415E423|nr:hypothetical protein [Micromonospora sp. WMMD710]MDG4761281.1 hypothetical protein [Micromonospora sp. WMMD710]
MLREQARARTAVPSASESRRQRQAMWATSASRNGTSESDTVKAWAHENREQSDFQAALTDYKVNLGATVNAHPEYLADYNEVLHTMPRKWKRPAPLYWLAKTMFSIEEQRTIDADEPKAWAHKNRNELDFQYALIKCKNAMWVAQRNPIDSEKRLDYLEVEHNKDPRTWVRREPLKWLANTMLSIEAQRAASAAAPNPYNEAAARRGNGPGGNPVVGGYSHQPTANRNAAHLPAAGYRRSSPR